jgi:hypothetical protein
MRGRLATQCGYTQEYIDAMDFLDVQKMSEFWRLEPPFDSLYLAAHFKREDAQQKMAIIPNTGASRPWKDQPEHIKQAIIAHYLTSNPGMTVEDFEADRVAQQTRRNKERLAEARRDRELKKALRNG